MRPLAAVVVALIGAGAPCGAAIVYDAPAGLTSAPADDRGWNQTGSWQVGGGVAITPHYFLTAQHLGGQVGNPFVLDGVSYPTVSFGDIPNTDLRVVKISGTFPTYSPLYRQAAGSENGQVVSFVGFGHYAQGDPVRTLAIQNGWLWGSATAKNRGMNTLQQDTDLGGMGHYLDYVFNPINGREEGVYTAGDSGGGAFINTGGVWRVAGITYSITQFYTAPTDASAINAAIYKPTGLFVKDPNNNFVPATDAQHGYATEVAAYLPQIDKLLGEPLPGDANHDGLVNFTDLLVLAQHYNSAGATFDTGDFNGDGRVAFDDLLLLAQHYGQTINNPPAAAADAAAIAVPEPTAPLCAALGIGFLLARRRTSSELRV